MADYLSAMAPVSTNALSCLRESGHALARYRAFLKHARKPSSHDQQSSQHGVWPTCAPNCAAYIAHNFSGTLGPREYTEPCRRFEALHHLADCWQVGKQLLPLRAGDAIAAQLAGAHLRRAGDETYEHHVDLAAKQVGQRRRRALVRQA